jgi:hypothetical protein
VSTPLSRAYDLTFDREYVTPPPEPPSPPRPPRPDPGPSLAGPIIWHGLDLMPGHMADDLTAVVENVEGWYGTPVFTGRDTERSLADGAAWGYKTLNAREVTLTGAAVGPRAPLMALRDQLAWRAAQREPAELAITDPWLDVTLTAMVRAGTDSFHHAFFGGRRAFRWSVTLTAADPLLYDREWQQLTLTTVTAEDSGRRYDRVYTAGEPEYAGWRYGSPYTDGPGGYLANRGNADAPVWALYEGDLTESRLTDTAASILLNPVTAGAQILVGTARLTAEAEGGQSRAAYIRPGSRPLLVPAFSTARWTLYAQGSGSVTLAWRSTWI